MPDQFIVSCCDPAPIFQMRDGALDHIATLAEDLVERWDFLAGRVGHDDRGAAPRRQEFAKLITLVGGVSQYPGDFWQRLDKA